MRSLRRKGSFVSVVSVLAQESGLWLSLGGFQEEMLAEETTASGDKDTSDKR